MSGTENTAPPGTPAGTDPSGGAAGGTPAGLLTQPGGPGGGAPGMPPGAPLPAGGATDPRAWLPEAYRSDPTFADLKDLDGLAKSYKHAATLVGVGAEDVLRLPKNPDGPEWDKVYARLGRPERPEGYELKAPEGLPPETVADFSKALHATGVSKAQAARIMDWYGAQVQGMAAAQAQEVAQATARTETALKAEWGAAYDETLHAARRALREVGGQEVIELLERTRLGSDPAIIRMFAALGRQRAEPSGLRGGGAEFAGALTPAQARSQIQALNGDGEFFKAFADRSAPGYRAAKEKWDLLHKFAYPEGGA